MATSPRLGPENEWAGEASSNFKRQTRPLVREGALNQQTRNCQTIIKIWSYAPEGCFIPRQTGRLTVGRNIRLRLSMCGTAEKKHKLVVIKSCNCSLSFIIGAVCLRVPTTLYLPSITLRSVSPCFYRFFV
jgi:hypothetical protein